MMLRISAGRLRKGDAGCVLRLSAPASKSSKEITFTYIGALVQPFLDTILVVGQPFCRARLDLYVDKG